jgi:hypothetical protein
MFERRHDEVLPLRLFVLRLLKCGSIAMILVFVALSLGVCGYHFLAGLPWVDALLNASMILTGMGPVDVLHSDAAKVFASAYALFSGLVFISMMALLLTPVAHRALHKFHLAEEDIEDDHPTGRKKKDLRQ